MFRGILVLAGLLLFGAIGAGPATPDTAGGTLIGTLSANNAFVITLTLGDGTPVNTPGTFVPSGDYTLTVTDPATIHEFHLIGPGFDQLVTTLPFTGTVTTTVHLSKGKWTFQCDPHVARGMIGTFNVDSAPVAGDDSASTTSGGTTTIPVLANDTDADGDALTPSIVGAPAHGTATVNPDGTINYTAPSSFAGTDTFTYSESDGSLTSNTATVTVAVNDATPPVLAPHADITGIDATSPAGATVSYTPPAATDNVDASPAVTCTPASGSTFAIGSTNVVCTATDAAGNAAHSSFAVQVKGGADQLSDLGTAVGGLDNLLGATVTAAQRFQAHGQVVASCVTLDLFGLEVRLEQLLRRIPAAQANALVADARQIQNVLGC